MSSCARIGVGFSGGGILWLNPRTQQEMLSIEQKLGGSILSTCVAGSLRHAV